MRGLFFWMLIITMVCQNVFTHKKPKLWPKPRIAKMNKKFVWIKPESYKLELQTSPPMTRNLLRKMTERAFINLRAECGNSVIKFGKKRLVIQMFVSRDNLSLTWETSEEYTLQVMNRSDTILPVNIFAETVYGARHALETLTQLSLTEKTRNNKCGIYVVSSAEIKDGPSFRHRGLLLDTARYYFELSHIKRTLDGMAASKMNVFHWHITDSQSFPLVSERMPELSRYGAFHSSAVYTKKDIQHITEYAQVQGIRVVIEIDGPAHSYNGWQWENEDRFGKKIIDCGENNGHLNIENPAIYKILRSLYRDIAEYLPIPILFHMGGDEVSYDCLVYDNHGLTSRIRTHDEFYELWAGYHNRALEVWDEEYSAAGGLKKQPVMLWSSDLTNPEHIALYLDPKRYVIEVWDHEESVPELLKLDYRIVLASTNWYLDHGFWGKTRYRNWTLIYSHKLPSHPNILGGEVAMWTEVVNESNLDSRIWPRAAAFAERLWSDLYHPDLREVESRLERHTTRLMARGLDPSSLTAPIVPILPDVDFGLKDVNRDVT